MSRLIKTPLTSLWPKFVVLIASLTFLGYCFLLIDKSFDRNFLVTHDFRAFYMSGLLTQARVGDNYYLLSTQFEIEKQFVPEMTNISQLAPFLFLPFVSIPFAVLSTLPMQPAYLAWLIVNIFILGFIVFRVWQLFPKNNVKYWLIAGILSFSPLIETLAQGQPSLFLALGLLESFIALRNNKQFLSGVWLALLLIKPYLLPLPILFLLLSRSNKALAGLVIAGGILLVISIWIASLGSMLSYPSVLTSAYTWGDAYTLHPQKMLTLQGLLQVLFSTNVLSGIIFVWIILEIIVFSLTILSWKGRLGQKDLSFNWSILIMSGLLLAPHGNFHDLSVLIVIGAILAEVITKPKVPLESKIVLKLVLIGSFLAIDSAVALGFFVPITVLAMLLAFLSLIWIRFRLI